MIISEASMGCIRRGNGDYAMSAATNTASVEDLEAKRERALSAFRSYTSQPLDDRPVIAPMTDGARHSRMEIWKM